VSQKYIKKISVSDERVDLSGDELEADSDSNFADARSTKGNEYSNDSSFGTSSTKSPSPSEFVIFIYSFNFEISKS
jgi:hypothetical protein